jgi:hypothetical protein
MSRVVGGKRRAGACARATGVIVLLVDGEGPGKDPVARPVPRPCIPGPELAASGRHLEERGDDPEIARNVAGVRAPGTRRPKGT